MTIKIIACEVMKHELQAVPNTHNVDYEFVSMGLHLYPEKLGKELQNMLDRTLGYDRVILAFGLCGGAGKDLRAGAFTLTVPQVHDCIPLLLGSRERFEECKAEEIGTFYLTCGWLQGERSIGSDYQRIREKYGEKKAASVFKRIYDSYRRILFIHTGNPQEEQYLKKSEEIGQLLQLSLQTIQGDLRYLERLVNGPWDEQHFINVPPGGMVKEEYFF